MLSPDPASGEAATGQLTTDYWTAVEKNEFGTDTLNLMVEPLYTLTNKVVYLHEISDSLS